MEDEEESEAAKLEVEINECKKKRNEAHKFWLASFREKILFDKCRGSR